MRNSEIASLVESLKGDEQGAFDKLYDSTWKMVYFLAYEKLDNRDDAMDVVQEVFAKVYTNINQLKSAEAFNQWIYQIIRNECNNIYRKRKKQNIIQLSDLATDIEEQRVEFLPDEILLREETGQEMLKIVTNLQQEYKEVILLYYYLQLSTNQIAEMLEINRVNVQKRLSRARKKIKQETERYRNKNHKIYTIGFVPLLKQIFLMEEERLCNDSIGTEIYNNINDSGIISNGVKNTVSPVTIKRTKGIVYKTAVIVSTILVISSVLYWAPLYHSDIAEEDDRPVMSRIESENAPMALEMEEIIGVEGVDLVKKWEAGADKNNKYEFEKEIIKWDLKMSSVHMALNESRQDVYILHYVEKDDKRFLICELYDSDNEHWTISYAIEDIDLEIPAAADLMGWFESHKN